MLARGSGDPLTPALSPRRGGRSPRSLRSVSRSGGAAAAARRSGRGRGGGAPTERKSEGGWVGRSGAQRTLLRDGGVGAVHRTRGYPAGPPTKDARLPSRLGRSDPHLRPLPEGAGAGALSRWPAGDPAGAWGQSPHMKENPRVGGWAGAARSARSSGMGVWGRFTARGDTPQGPPRRTRACPRGSQSGYVLAAACSARRAIARGRPSKMRRWMGQSAYQ